MLKRILPQLLLYHLIVVFVLSTSGYAAAQESGHIYTTRATGGDSVPFEPPIAETGAYYRRTATGPTRVDDHYAMNRVIVSGASIGFAVLVGAVAYIGMSVTDDDDGSGAGGSRAADTINFRSPIRIGDDNDYNGTHDDNFQINTPFGLTYSESFTVSGGLSKGTLKYTIAGAKESAEIYMNGSLVGRSCNPGNTAYAKKKCDPVDVTSQLKNGNNVLKIACVLDPYDDVTPYDDIEIYNMRLILER